jgi:hypothetical protein
LLEEAREELQITILELLVGLEEEETVDTLEYQD